MGGGEILPWLALQNILKNVKFKHFFVFPDAVPSKNIKKSYSDLILNVFRKNDMYTEALKNRYKNIKKKNALDFFLNIFLTIF